MGSYQSTLNERWCDQICIYDFSNSYIGSELEKAINGHWGEDKWDEKEQCIIIRGKIQT